MDEKVFKFLVAMAILFIIALLTPDAHSANSPIGVQVFVTKADITTHGHFDKVKADKIIKSAMDALNGATKCQGELKVIVENVGIGLLITVYYDCIWKECRNESNNLQQVHEKSRLSTL